MIKEVENAIKQVRPDLIAQGSDVELLSATELGIVTVGLSGKCCSNRLTQLRTVLDLEVSLKRLVPKIKIVMEDADYSKCPTETVGNE